MHSVMTALTLVTVDKEEAAQKGRQVQGPEQEWCYN